MLATKFDREVFPLFIDIVDLATSLLQRSIVILFVKNSGFFKVNFLDEDFENSFDDQHNGSFTENFYKNFAISKKRYRRRTLSDLPKTLLQVRSSLTICRTKRSSYERSWKLAGR